MLRRALVMIPILAMSLRSDSGPSGKWRVRYDGDPAYAQKTIGSMLLDLKVEGQIVSGTTGIPTCVFDVTVDGDTMHASFRVTQNPGGPLAGNREYRFVGTRVSSTNN